MVDFSKLLKTTPEERLEQREASERRWVEQELQERAESATDFRRLTLTEDPEIRYDRSGFPFARFTSERDGQRYAAVINPFHNEDSRDFAGRMGQLKVGDEITAHGHEEDRRWKDGQGQWKSVKEFHIDVPLAPESLKPSLPDDLEFPQSSFARKQAELASRQRGMGM